MGMLCFCYFCDERDGIAWFLDSCSTCPITRSSSHTSCIVFTIPKHHSTNRMGDKRRALCFSSCSQWSQGYAIHYERSDLAPNRSLLPIYTSLVTGMCSTTAYYQTEEVKVLYTFLRGPWLSVDEEGEGERQQRVLAVPKGFLVSAVSLL